MSAPALAGSWACRAELERVLDGLVALDCRTWSPLTHSCLASHSHWFLVAVVAFLEHTASQFGCARISGGSLRNIGMRFHEQLNYPGATNPATTVSGYFYRQWRGVAGRDWYTLIAQ